jgi:hypothetical protein
MTIYTNNQATIHALQDPGGPSGQYILRAIVSKIDRLYSLIWHACFFWLLGYTGAYNNKLTDTAAKAVAQNASITFAHEEPNNGLLGP